jgi:hypothetical protein
MTSQDDGSRPLTEISQTGSSLPERPSEPPVVARMVIEIRSDGSTTIARGALDDASTGARVSMEARGSSPAALVASLARSLLLTPLGLMGGRAPRLVRAVSRALPESIRKSLPKRGT